MGFVLVYNFSTAILFIKKLSVVCETNKCFVKNNKTNIWAMYGEGRLDECFMICLWELAFHTISAYMTYDTHSTLYGAFWYFLVSAPCLRWRSGFIIVSEDERELLYDSSRFSSIFCTCNHHQHYQTMLFGYIQCFILFLITLSARRSSHHKKEFCVNNKY